MKLLHIDSGIQGDNSSSRTISAAIVGQLRNQAPELEVTYRDLVDAPFGHLLPADLASDEATATVDEFLAADIVVIGTGLYNFTVPTQLKAWVDRILMAGRTFRYSEAGAEGLAGGKRVIVALTRGGFYSSGSPIAAWEHAESWLRTVLSFIGIHDPEFIVAEGLAMGDEQRATAMAAALDRAASLPPPQPALAA